MVSYTKEYFVCSLLDDFSDNETTLDTLAKIPIIKLNTDRIIKGMFNDYVLDGISKLWNKTLYL